MTRTIPAYQSVAATILSVTNRGERRTPEAITHLWDCVQLALEKDGNPSPRQIEARAKECGRKLADSTVEGWFMTWSTVPTWERFQSLVMALSAERDRDWKELHKAAQTAKAEAARQRRITERQGSGEEAGTVLASPDPMGREPHRRKGRTWLWPDDTSDPDAQIVSAADALAEHMWQQWRHEAGDRGLHRLEPIAVRWKWSPRAVTGPVEVAVGAPQSYICFPALPGVPSVTEDTLQAGNIRDLFGVYGGLASGLVVILGDPGTGKTASAILTLLAALRHRRSCDNARRATVPVPVMLTAYGWDPRSQDLCDWLTDRLARDYKFLESRDYGRNAAERLVEDGRVALFLDGFDEMAPELRPMALQAIARQAKIRLVLLTRIAEFADAVKAGHLHGAAALELCPVSASDAADYLRRCRVQPLPPAWERLIDHLERQPDSVLARALDSPLNLTLIRDAYPEADSTTPDQLLVPGRFVARDDVDAHLLDRFLDIAYPETAGEPYSLAQARRSLSYIGTRMRIQNTRDLDWRRLHWWASPIPRVLIAGLLGAIFGALVGALVFGPAGQYVVRNATGMLFGTVYGAGMGVTFGLLAGFAAELRDLRPRRLGRFRWGGVLRTRFNLAVGLLAGLAVALAVGNQTGYLFGLPAGLLTGSIAGRSAASDVVPGRARGDRIRWRTLRSRFAAATGATAGILIGMAYGFTEGAAEGLIAGLVSALTSGLITGFSRPSVNVDSPTDPITSWRRDCWRGATFGLAAGIPSGLALGIANGAAHGFTSGAIAAMGFGCIIGLGGAVGVSDSWRTILTFLQLRRRSSLPVRGMAFLEDACERGVLRRVGPIYQFRHARLQDRLIRAYHMPYK